MNIGAASSGSQVGDDPDDPTLAILHLDMDSFYVSVEVLRDPSLAGRPVVVGGTGSRGVVASASYEARAYGVRSAMATARARRLCPDAVFVQGDHAAYGEVSAELHRILGSVTPVIEPIALDEAFLDVAAARRLFGSGREIAWMLREKIHDELHLGCSVGVAAKKLFAKLASEDAKPIADRRGTRPGSGVRVITAVEELLFLHALPVRALWGVGPKTFERLARFGVVTIGDLSRIRLDVLEAALGPSLSLHLHDLSRGLDPRPVVSERGVKSISHEETFSADLTERHVIDDAIVRLSDAVASRLRGGEMKATTVHLKLRFADFATITRSAKQPMPLDTGPGLARVVKAMIDQLEATDGDRLADGVRLIGVAATGFDDVAGGAVQLSLDDLAGGSAAERATDEADWSSVSEAIDEIRDRFGRGAIGPAPAVRRREPGRDVWGPSVAEESDDGS